MNVASTAAFLPGPHMAVYHASKAYVLNFTEAIGEELKDMGITVTALCPGPTESKFQESADMGGVKFMSGKLPSAEEVAEFGYNAMMEGKRVAIHGLGNKLVTEIPRFAPRKAVSFVVSSIYGRKS
jgi:short-subunit dehydrogenase